MPSAGLGGLGARGGVRVWTSGGALHASTERAHRRALLVWFIERLVEGACAIKHL